MMVELKNRRPMLFTADACYSKKNMDMNVHLELPPRSRRRA